MGAKRPLRLVLLNLTNNSSILVSTVYYLTEIFNFPTSLEFKPFVLHEISNILHYSKVQITHVKLEVYNLKNYPPPLQGEMIFKVMGGECQIALIKIKSFIFPIQQKKNFAPQKHTSGGG